MLKGIGNALKRLLGFLWAVITFKHLRAWLSKRKKPTRYGDPLEIYPEAVKTVGEKPRSFVIEFDEEGGGLAYKIVFGKEPKQGRPPKDKKEEKEPEN